jgi:hypothetical protein
MRMHGVALRVEVEVTRKLKDRTDISKDDPASHQIVFGFVRVLHVLYHTGVGGIVT